ncbi:ATP-grasp domain-containing protein [Campylobacter mucosalis]|uniref:ATP-grasp domain-containing protein n=1 Tax=Campylobacter mucosalis TaxID=202 RepID=UPI00146FF1A5
MRELFRRKIGVMKQNLRDINCEIITKNFTPKEFPLIIKPRFGSGSRDVMVCFNKDEFDKILSEIDVFKEDFLAETLVFGTEIGVDGVVIDGVFKSVLMREKIITPYPFRQCVANVAINEVLTVSKHIQKAVAILGIKNSLLNADVIIKDDGSVFIIELAPRPSGHYLSSVFLRLVTGVSLVDEWLNFMQNLPFDFTPKFYKQALIKYFDFDFEIDEFMRLKDEFKIVKYECNNSQNLGEVKDGKSIMNRGFAVILGSDKNECIKRANELIKTLKKA